MWVFSLARTGNSQVCDSLFHGWKQLCHTQVTKLILWTWLTALPKSVQICYQQETTPSGHKHLHTNSWQTLPRPLCSSLPTCFPPPQGRKELSLSLEETPGTHVSAKACQVYTLPSINTAWSLYKSALCNSQGKWFFKDGRETNKLVQMTLPMSLPFQYQYAFPLKGISD